MIPPRPVLIILFLVSLVILFLIREAFPYIRVAFGVAIRTANAERARGIRACVLPLLFLL
jgi:hypothetical protein